MLHPARHLVMTKVRGNVGPHAGFTAIPVHLCRYYLAVTLHSRTSARHLLITTVRFTKPPLYVCLAKTLHFQTLSPTSWINGIMRLPRVIYGFTERIHCLMNAII